MSLIIIPNNCLSKYMLEIYNKNSFNTISSIHLNRRIIIVYTYYLYV